MIDKNKQYRTRDGCEVRIYATDGYGVCSVHGAFLEGGGWEQLSWPSNGLFGGDHPADLIEVKPRIKREVWVNVYPEGLCFYYTEKQARDGRSRGSCIACHHYTIDCEEGEGL